MQESKQRTVTNTRTSKMNDDVLVVAVSPDAKYIAVALLDCTIKVSKLLLLPLCVFIHIDTHRDTWVQTAIFSVSVTC